MPTVGQILVKEAIPPELWREDLVLDKKGLRQLLEIVAKQSPDKYRDISFRLNQLGRDAAYTSGGNSFGPKDMRRAASAIALRAKLQPKINAVLDDDSLTEQQRAAALIKLAGSAMDQDREDVYAESIKEKNPLGMQLLGAGRGNKATLRSMRGSDWLYQDHRGSTIPVPVTRSYSQGLSPLEYWAGTYGARMGVLATKFATADAGYFGKQLNQITHRNIVTALDRDGDPVTTIGLPTTVDDNDNEGALLAKEAGGYARNTVLTPKILRDLQKRGIKNILVRSPMVSGAPDGGILARDAGIREFGDLPAIGESVGQTAAQALGEPVSQGQLSQKHSGGVAGEANALSGFEYLNALIQVPKKFRGGAAHSELDGVVHAVDAAPAGGHFVTIGDKQHYVAAGFDPIVKVGDKVEAGDVISNGTPNPAIITRYKGIGEGRKYFASAFVQAMRDGGMSGNRRNVELLARGLINHVRLTDEIGDFAPDDVVPYSSLEHSYQPREGFQAVDPRRAVGKYLERPYLHYSIGTQVKPSMVKTFGEFGVNSLDVHNEPPPFEPEMIRGMANLHHDPDWMTRMFGSGLKGSFLDSVHRGGTSDAAGTSFVPSRAKAVDFGHAGKVMSPDRKLGY